MKTINKLIVAALSTAAIYHPINAQQNMKNRLNQQELNIRLTDGKEAGDSASIKNSIFPKGELNVAYANYFIGNSYLAELANGGGKLQVTNVTFEPRCRNNWHIHHKGGQILICVNGRGWYQEWGKPAQELHPGDVIDIPAETKHWHGAANDSWFQHIAIGVPAEGASAEWLESVTDAEYDKLK